MTGRGLALLGLWLCACASSARPTTGRTAEPKPAWKRSCTEYARAPVSVEYEDASGGAAVVYRTRGDVAALRQRTHEVAQFHNSSEAKLGALHDLSAIPHRARVEEVEDGARLVLTPKGARPQLLDALRLQVQQETFTLRRRGCGSGQEAL
ncbi:MAG TPA: hypothetical protein VFZ61_15740 [Polyangiales bacterium]